MTILPQHRARRRKEGHLWVFKGRTHAFSTLGFFLFKCEEPIQRMWWRKEDTQEQYVLRGKADISTPVCTISLV